MKHGLCWPLLATALLATQTARAHAVGLSQGEYRVTDAGLAAELTFVRAELGEPADAAARRLLQSITVTDVEGRPCAALLTRLETAESNVTLRAEYHCPAQRVELRFWDELSPGHRHLVRSLNPGAGPEPAALLLQRESARFELTSNVPAPSEPSAFGWVRLGVEHILAGYDHLAFLLALVLAAVTLRSLAALVSLFTLAHSLTLALASLELYAPPSALVEAAIAASICFVGCENLTARAQRGRAALVFGFGLIHGFGFAGALREIGVRSAQTPLALFGFNLGVELGQLALLAAVFPLVQRARRAAWFQRRGLLVLNTAIALAGACWLVLRIVDGGLFEGSALAR